MAQNERSFSDVMYYLPLENGVILWRKDGKVITNVPHAVTHHSPDGFEFGYGGSGPADLALNICEIMLNRLDYAGERVKCFEGSCWDLAWTMHQSFKRDFIAGAGRDGETIPYETIETWIKRWIDAQVRPSDE